jgi:glucose/arabinose dehydrogenase/PKD repeat protein
LGGHFSIRGIRFIVLGLLIGLLCAPSSAYALMTTLPQYEDQPVANVQSATQLAFTPDGRLLITARAGTLRIYKNGALQPNPALNIPASQICYNVERGLLGLAVDPSFASNHYIYLYYTFNKYGDCSTTTGSNTPVNRVSRFTLGNNDVVDPASETILLDNIPSPTGLHNSGDVQFGKDGYLYVTVGDGSCDFRLDSGCGPINDAAHDLSAPNGKVLRITSSGGIPPGNPFQGAGTQRCNVDGFAEPPTRCREIFASGLRNPWRLAFDPNAAGTSFYINDVGLSKWEEIDVGANGADYGWNVREGPCYTDSYSDCGPTPPGTTNPIYAYPHTSGCASIIGGVFAPVGKWTPDIDGAYLFGDLVCGKIFKLIPAGDGTYTTTEFATPIGTNWLISMIVGPYAGNDAIYYITWNDGNSAHEVRRIAFTGQANRSPVARATASPTHGDPPLNVSFDGTTSFDPDGDPLTYEWDFGDGSAHQTSATATHTYAAAGEYNATLTVRDDRGGEGTTTIHIDTANDPPVPQIDAPLATKLFRVGETITLKGEATDPEEGPLSDDHLTLEVIKHHNTHVHPFFPSTQGNNFTITAPEPEDINSTDNSYLEIILTATDSNGSSASVHQDLRPHVVNLSFLSNPYPLKLKVVGSTVTTPQTVPSWEGWDLPVEAPNQATSSGSPYNFSSWNDGGAASHTITTPGSSTGFVATFVPGGYARPKGATPTVIRLVPAYRSCSPESANETHGEPLSVSSCDPPLQDSESLTVGTPDTNGYAANGTGLGVLKGICTDGVQPPCNAPGDTADVTIQIDLTDVRCTNLRPSCSPLGLDYSGKLFAKIVARTSDRLNGTYGNAVATAMDVPLDIPIDCVATSDPSIGSDCNVQTTADSLYPGIVSEGSRAVWNLGILEVYDAGPNGTGLDTGCPPTCGDGDEQVFQHQGLFAP